ncbi:hypothetical protein [Enterovibrio norvegicus]|uniref:Uncharacterized protein n=2 Tax=Enterovibrio norvegicus TaxID=188144 RepID=A0A1I5Y1H8_9GAMM|nr:hypothetical protein [Enterovibrio norvegicus]OEF60176.1 hypothetical protein A1OU_02995 [Enterovibrio norvegicus]SFQ38043.1 hypothetical protein SAMN03084138_04914 [Enterovibrio norvegicus DSM 15893]
MKKIMFIWSLVILSFPAFSGSSAGKVGDMLITSDGVLLFTAGAHQNPGCPTPAWGVETKTAEGKSLMSVVLMAAASDRTIEVSGQGVGECIRDREKVDLIIVKQ